MRIQNQSGTIKTADGGKIHFLLLGNGRIPLVIIRGIEDSFCTIDKSKLRLSLCYRKRLDDYRILILSRREPIPDCFSIEEFADDMSFAFKEIGQEFDFRWDSAFWECHSAGGPIGQIVALKEPEIVKGLVLASTFHRSNSNISSIVNNWFDLMNQGLWEEFSWNLIESVYSKKKVRALSRMKNSINIVSPVPDDTSRIRNCIESQQNFDNSDKIKKLALPVLVAGGSDDLVVPFELQAEMASLIPGARVRCYPGLGHSFDQESDIYEEDMKQFCTEVLRASDI